MARARLVDRRVDAFMPRYPAYDVRHLELFPIGEPRVRNNPSRVPLPPTVDHESFHRSSRTSTPVANALYRSPGRGSSRDSAIVAAKQVFRCDAVYSEDLSAGQDCRGLRVIDPFQLRRWRGSAFPLTRERRGDGAGGGVQALARRAVASLRVRPTSSPAARMPSQVTGSTGTPSAFRLARVMRSGSPGTRTGSSGFAGGEEVT